jgi:hypothetical protein
MSMEPHPAIALYGRTHQHKFPLVLVVGREPNNDHDRTEGTGTYDFYGKNGQKRCAFWNTAYGTMARLAPGLTTGRLKQICERADASPIAFADALPAGLCNGEANKKQRRRAISDQEISTHIREVFSQEVFSQSKLPRVSMILLSGLEIDEFSRSVALIEKEAKARGIDCRHVPFFFGNNAKKIRAAIEGSSEIALRRIAHTFFAAFPDKLAPYESSDV